LSVPRFIPWLAHAWKKFCVVMVPLLVGEVRIARWAVAGGEADLDVEAAFGRGVCGDGGVVGGGDCGDDGQAEAGGLGR